MSFEAIRDPLARDLYCMLRCPTDVDQREVRGKVLRRVLDEWRRRHRERIDAFLREIRGTHAPQSAEPWPESWERLVHVVDLCLSNLGKPALPHSRDCAAALEISPQAYNRNWRRVAEWVHDDLGQMLLTADQQARAANSPGRPTLHLPRKLAGSEKMV